MLLFWTGVNYPCRKIYRNSCFGILINNTEKSILSCFILMNILKKQPWYAFQSWFIWPITMAKISSCIKFKDFDNRLTYKNFHFTLFSSKVIRLLNIKTKTKYWNTYIWYTFIACQLRKSENFYNKFINKIRTLVLLKYISWYFSNNSIVYFSKVLYRVFVIRDSFKSLLTVTNRNAFLLLKNWFLKLYLIIIFKI